MFHVKTGQHAATFDLGGPVQDLVFSENGIWFAAVVTGSNSVVIFDLRKEGEAAKAKVLEIGGQVDTIKWDYTGQFLAAARTWRTYHLAIYEILEVVVRCHQHCCSSNCS